MMKTSTPFQHFNITRAGTIARACLAPGQRGSVLAAFSRAIYLQSEAGELFWITALDEPMHRRCAQMASPLPELSSGSQFRVNGHILIIDNRWILDTGNASTWSEPSVDRIVGAVSLFTRAQTFFSSLDLPRAKGFGSFIPFILSLTPNALTEPEFSPADPELRYAGPRVVDIAKACLEKNEPAILRCSDRLVGLGSGLTPSGDDLLGGMFFALRLLHQHYPDLCLHDYTSMTERYLKRTHFISYTLLNDLAHGHTVAPLHQLANGLIGGRPIVDLYPCVSQLSRVGHSTGWDLLTGLLVGLLTTNRSHYFIPSFQLTKSIEI